MSPRLVIIIGSIIAVALLAIATASAKEPPRVLEAVAVPPAEPAGERLPLPEPPTELAPRYPRTSHARILRLADGRLALAIARDDGLSQEPRDWLYDLVLRALWVVELDADGAPARKTWLPHPRLGLPVGILPTRGGGYFVHRGAPLRRFDRDWHLMWRAQPWSDWTRQFHTTAAVELPQGGFLVIGVATEDNPDPFVDRAVRFDDGGQRLWERDISLPRDHPGRFSMIALADGGAVISTWTAFYRIDATGRRLWRRKSRGYFDLYPSSAGTFMLAGSGHSWPPGESGPRRNLVIGYDIDGRELWRRDGFGSDRWQKYEPPASWFPQPDGGIIHYIRRHVMRGQEGEPDCRAWTEHALARFDAAGTFRWARNLRGDDDRPCDSPRHHALRDINVLPNGQMLLLWYATDDDLDEKKTVQWWLTSMPFD